MYFTKPLPSRKERFKRYSLDNILPSLFTGSDVRAPANIGHETSIAPVQLFVLLNFDSGFVNKCVLILL